LVLALVTAATLVAAGSAFGIYTAVRSRRAVQPVEFTPARAPGADSVDPEGALASVMGHADASDVLAAAIGSPPSGWARANLPWLHFTVRVPAMKEGLDIEPQWQADLIEGAVADLSGANADQAQNLGGSVVSAQLPDGTVVSDIGGGIGDVVHGQAFSSANDATLRAYVGQVLAEYGLDAVEVSTVRAFGVAPSVVAIAHDVSAFAPQYKGFVDSLVGSPPVYEGYYVEIRDPAGNPVLRASAAFRTGAGRLWIDPRNDGQFGVSNGGYRQRPLRQHHAARFDEQTPRLFLGRRGRGPLCIAWDTNLLLDYFQHGRALGMASPYPSGPRRSAFKRRDIGSLPASHEA